MKALLSMKGYQVKRLVGRVFFGLSVCSVEPPVRFCFGFRHGGLGAGPRQPLRFGGHAAQPGPHQFARHHGLVAEPGHLWLVCP